MISHGTARSERILTLTKALFAEQDTLPLDTIDGEFFWRICQEPVARLLEAYTDPPKPAFTGAEFSADALWARHEYLQEHRRAWLAFEREHRRLLAPVPGPIVGYLRLGERVPMRPPLIWQTTHHPHFPALQVFVMHVHSGEWTGRQVGAALAREREFDPFLVDGQEKYAWLASERFGSESSALHVTAFLHRDAPPRTDETWPLWDAPEAPCIEVVLQFPLPDAELVAQFYDTSVRAKHGWHEALPGGQANGQHKEVAIRTWAIGLLMAAGLPYFRAMGEVLDLCNKEALTQGRFAAARTQLLKRVPEAGPYLFAAR